MRVKSGQVSFSLKCARRFCSTMRMIGSTGARSSSKTIIAFPLLCKSDTIQGADTDCRRAERDCQREGSKRNWLLYHFSSQRRLCENKTFVRNSIAYPADNQASSRLV